MSKNVLKKVTGQIADASGHTDYAGTLDEAVDYIMDQAKTAGRWAYVNGSPFMFSSFNEKEKTALYNALDAEENPEFVLTGKLQGGLKVTKSSMASSSTKPLKAVYRRRVTRRPMSKVIANTPPLIAISVAVKDGNEVVDCTFSDYRDGLQRVAKHAPSIIALLQKTLRELSTTAPSDVVVDKFEQI